MLQAAQQTSLRANVLILCALLVNETLNYCNNLLPHQPLDSYLHFWGGWQSPQKSSQTSQPCISCGDSTVESS